MGWLYRYEDIDAEEVPCECTTNVGPFAQALCSRHHYIERTITLRGQSVWSGSNCHLFNIQHRSMNPGVGMWRWSRYQEDRDLHLEKTAWSFVHEWNEDRRSQRRLLVTAFVRTRRDDLEASDVVLEVKRPSTLDPLRLVTSTGTAESVH